MVAVPAVVAAVAGSEVDAPVVAVLDGLNRAAASIAVLDTLNDAAVIAVLDALDEVFDFISVEGAVQGVGDVESFEGGGVEPFGAPPALLLDLDGGLVVGGLNVVVAAAADEFPFGRGRHGWSAEGGGIGLLLSLWGRSG